jgi:hypothetical protein
MRQDQVEVLGVEVDQRRCQFRLRQVHQRRSRHLKAMGQHKLLGQLQSQRLVKPLSHTVRPRRRVVRSVKAPSYKTV